MDVALGPADLGEGDLRPFEVAGRYVLVARISGALHAIDDLCNHAGCLLSGGWTDGTTIICPCHEYRFDLLTGQNVTFPRLCGDQAVFPLRVEGGQIVVTLPEGAR